MQLESELQWMEKNPGQTPPWVESRMYGSGSGTMDFSPSIPNHINIDGEQPLSLGLDFNQDTKQTRGADGKFAKKE